MDAAIYALIANVCVALMFAIAFAVIGFSYAGWRVAGWFCATYLFGMLTPASELAVHFLPWSDLFVATSYVSFVFAVLAMPMGLAALAGDRLPWRTAIVIMGGGFVLRIATWGGARGTITHELLFQTPFIAASALSVMVAMRAARRQNGAKWLPVAIVFAFLTTYFALKPVAAALFGSGDTARDYAASTYALFSQATAGVLTVMAGLLLLLMVVQSAMRRSISDSETDPLTGILNRRGLVRQAEAMIEAARGRAPLAALMIDLDHFKQVNDRFGHATGDAVIRAFARQLSASMPSSAIVARVGGEEFAVLLERTTAHGAWLAAQAMRHAITQLGPHLPQFTFSGGIAEFQPGDTLESLMDRADARTYEAKASGRDRISPLPVDDQSVLSEMVQAH